MWCLKVPKWPRLSSVTIPISTPTFLTPKSKPPVILSSSQQPVMRMPFASLYGLQTPSSFTMFVRAEKATDLVQFSGESIAYQHIFRASRQSELALSNTWEVLRVPFMFKKRSNKDFPFIIMVCSPGVQFLLLDTFHPSEVQCLSWRQHSLPSSGQCGIVRNHMALQNSVIGRSWNFRIYHLTSQNLCTSLNFNLFQFKENSPYQMEWVLPIRNESCLIRRLCQSNCKHQDVSWCREKTMIPLAKNRMCWGSGMSWQHPLNTRISAGNPNYKLMWTVSSSVTVAYRNQRLGSRNATTIETRRGLRDAYEAEVTTASMAWKSKFDQWMHDGQAYEWDLGRERMVVIDLADDQQQLMPLFTLPARDPESKTTGVANAILNHYFPSGQSYVHRPEDYICPGTCWYQHPSMGSNCQSPKSCFGYQRGISSVDIRSATPLLNHPMQKHRRFENSHRTPKRQMTRNATTTCNELVLAPGRSLPLPPKRITAQFVTFHAAIMRPLDFTIKLAAILRNSKWETMTTTVLPVMSHAAICRTSINTRSPKATPKSPNADFKFENPHAL